MQLLKDLTSKKEIKSVSSPVSSLGEDAIKVSELC